MYLESPNHHDDRHQVRRRSRRSNRSPVARGVTVATTSTTDGADLLVSGAVPGGSEVRKYALGRPAPDATTLAPKLIADPARDAGCRRRRRRSAGVR